ncbi:MAG: hypothetical protein GY717_19900 [Rhodobacteraceae bacterium]|nr:hypothetical protein [Paracoccaceae bacterium]
MTNKAPRFKCLAVLAALLMLAGCLQSPIGGGAAKRKLPETIRVAGGAIVVGGPAGYCVDRGGSRLGGDTAFVLLGSCASIMRDAGVIAPPNPGLLTASVASGTGTGTESATDAALKQLRDFLVSENGRAALARDGLAGSVEIIESRVESSAVLIHLRDHGANITPGLDKSYWRGLFDLNGRLVTISVLGFAGQPMSTDAGLATLRGFLARIRTETETAAAKGLRTQKRLFPALFN